MKSDDPVRVFATHMLMFAREEALAGNIGWAWWLWNTDDNLWLDVLGIPEWKIKREAEGLLIGALVANWRQVGIQPRRKTRRRKTTIQQA